MPGWNPPANPSKLLRSMAPDSLRSPHILASPPGTPAPIGAINYTPKTGEVHQPGVLAPVDQLNYSLLPASGGTGLGSGGGFSAGMGMGTDTDMPRQGSLGGAPPLTPGQERMVGRYSSPASMASGTYSPGSPPSQPGPFGTGPGPRISPSGPREAPLGVRGSMTGNARGWGMGGGQDTGTSQPGGLTDDQLTALGSAAGLDSNSDSTGSDGGTTTTDASGTQQTQSTATSDGQTNPAPAGWKVDVPPNAAVGTVVYAVSPDGSTRLPMWIVGSIDPVTRTPKLQNISASDQALILGKSSSSTKNAGHIIRRNPDGTNHIWTTDPSTGLPQEDLGPSGTQPAAPKAPTDVGQLKPVGSTGIVMRKQPDGTWIIDQAATSDAQAQIAAKQQNQASVQAEVIRAAQAQATDKPYTIVTGSDGASYAVNTEDPTGANGVVKVTNADPTKNIMTAGNSLIKVDDNGGATPIYTAPKGWGVTTVGGRTIAYNQDDPSKTQVIAEDPTFGPQAAATLQGTKASTLSTLNAIQSGQITTEQARETLLQNVHDLLHPQPTLSSAGYLVPAGAELDVNYMTVQGGPQRGTQHISGGPPDAEAQAIAKQVNDYLADWDKRQAQVNQTFGQQIGDLGGQPQQAQPVQQQQQPAAPEIKTGVPQGAADTVGGGMLPAGQTGIPGVDPRLSGGVQPPHNVTTAAGDIAQYDAGGQLTGIRYINTAPPHYGEPGYPGSPGYDQGGDSLSVGLDQSTADDSGGGDGSDSEMGGGQEDFMGRGLVPRRGRGSTGAGWSPRQGPQGAGHMSNFWQPKGYGTGGEAGMGAGGVYVQSKDGSMRWDETAIDPNPSGGSVVQEGTQHNAGGGTVVQGANRQSGSTGPGGTGPAGSQAQALHAAELQANPTFASTPSSPFLSNAWQTMPSNTGQPGGMGNYAPGAPGYAPGNILGGDVGSTLSGNVNPAIANPQTNPLMPVAHQVDPFYTAPLLTPSPMTVKPLGSLTQPGERPGQTLGLGGGHEAYGAGQGGSTPSGMPMGAQSPDYQRGYQDGMNAGRNPGTPPLFTPGLQQPTPGIGDQQQDQGGMGGGQEMGAGQDPLYHYILSRRGQGSRLGMGTGQGPSPQPPMGPPGGGAPPPGGPGGPGGASGWMPPLAPGNVAGIGHRFGQQMDQGEPQHSGVDLQALEGTPTISPVDGVVERVEHNPAGLGLTVVVRGKDGSEHRLGHLSRTRAYPGMVVAQGQDLASEVGSTGNTTGSHLHWGVRDQQGAPTDPTNALPPGMQQMPPVPGTEMMGPPGGNGGQAQMPGGAGQDLGAGGPLEDLLGETQQMDTSKWLGGMPMRLRLLREGGALPKASDLEGIQGQPTMPEFPFQPGATGTGQESADVRWDLYEAKDTTGFMGPGAGQQDPDPQWSQIIPLEYPNTEGALASQAGGYAPGESEYAGWHPLNKMRRMGIGDISPDALGTGQDDGSYDDYALYGAGGEGGMGAGAVAGVTPDQQAAVDAQIQAANISAQAQQHAADQQYAVGMAQVQANLQAENDRHAEAMSQLQQQAAFHQDDVALKQMEDAENQRHNQATEQLQAQATQMQQTLESMREQNNVQLEQMQEANAVKLEMMKEGNAVYMQQGQQAFQDWQTQQADRMSILSSALNNPWLQQLTGMTPAPGQAGTATGGQNLANLIQQVLTPFNYQAWGGQGAQGQNAPAPQQAPAMYQGGGAPGIQTPTWSQWQGWNPFQMAAYRTNIEAMGPGVWNDVQGQMQTSFAGQGGNPNVTQMQAAAATPEQQAGQQMTANLFGETTPEWQQNQQKMWSQSQAPKVQTNLSGIAA